jgi:hypothetical protein
MVEMIVDSIRVSMLNYQRVVILKEKSSERYLPIWIGPAEADAIAVKLQGVAVPRPLTHDLLRSVIVNLGASVNSIVVCDLRNDTFFAKIILSLDGKQMEIDSRPSDAIALAVGWGYTVLALDGEKHYFETKQEADQHAAQLTEHLKGHSTDPPELEVQRGLPIYAEESVLDKAGIIIDPETGKPSPAREIPPEELERMSAFRDFIESLDLSDFGKGKPEA